MCGIGAIINGKTEKITEMMSPIRARGEPESFNEHEVIGNTVLSCNRLKIVGRDTGKQPVRNEDKTIFAVFNGEIYNYEQLKKELEEAGHIFSTETDTEILVHGFEEWGNNLPKFLDGQFAFVVYDKKNGKYLAVRDHFGIKPLFWAEENGTVYFASELKQLVGFVKEIKEVLPSHFIADGNVERYYTLKSKENNDNIENAKIKIRTLFDEAVKKRVNTDLPIAVFLSGGIDSTAVLATAEKYHNKVAAIVVGNYWESDDSDYKAAMKYCKENDIPVIARNPPTEQELFDMIPEIVRVTESFEPNMIKQSGLSLFLSKIAKEHGFKVVLCGEGADEVFCGYPEFTKIAKEKIKELSFDFFNNLYRTQLQRVDKTSMSHTIEVRVPFMDKKLVEYPINLASELKIN
jgi:asparagine synthase (glutamine-hydrolysing)